MLTTQDETKIRKMIRGEFERVGIRTSTGLDSKAGRKIIEKINKLVSYKKDSEIPRVPTKNSENYIP